MTDKQMEEKKREFLEKFGLVGYEYNTTGVWQWISKLVEEVEREASKVTYMDERSKWWYKKGYSDGKKGATAELRIN